jgi:hypothetical protein
MTAALLLFALAFEPVPATERPSPPVDPVNAVIGDESWVVRFGAPPARGVADTDRIRVHLEHVEAVLRAERTSGLDAAQRAERALNLDRLHAYVAAGRFPRNDVMPGRHPRFIDAQGNACAVGHLMIVSGAGALAAAIDRDHEWAELTDIPSSPELERWIAASGLTPVELATIQPGYDFMHPQPIEPRPEPRPRPSPILPNAPKRPDRAHARMLLQSAAPLVQQCLAAAPQRVPRVRVVATWDPSGRLASVTVDRLPAPTQTCVLRAINHHARQIPPFRGRPFRLAFRYPI